MPLKDNVPMNIPTPNNICNFFANTRYQHHKKQYSKIYFMIYFSFIENNC